MPDGRATVAKVECVVCKRWFKPGGLVMHARFVHTLTTAVLARLVHHQSDAEYRECIEALNG